MKCPKCPTHELRSVLSEEGFTLDYCGSCFGIWFDSGETAEHFSLAEDIPNLEAALQSARKTELHCPRCQAELQELKYDEAMELLVDRCVGCHGIWFDFHETEKLNRWAAGQESPRARVARAVQRLKDNDYKVI